MFRLRPHRRRGLRNGCERRLAFSQTVLVTSAPETKASVAPNSPLLLGRAESDLTLTLHLSRAYELDATSPLLVSTIGPILRRIFERVLKAKQVTHARDRSRRISLIISQCHLFRVEEDHSL
jgi:hypothetical protein